MYHYYHHDSPTGTVRFGSGLVHFILLKPKEVGLRACQHQSLCVKKKHFTNVKYMFCMAFFTF